MHSTGQTHLGAVRDSPYSRSPLFPSFYSASSVTIACLAGGDWELRSILTYSQSQKYINIITYSSI